ILFSIILVLNTLCFNYDKKLGTPSPDGLAQFGLILYVSRHGFVRKTTQCNNSDKLPSEQPFEV
ncbi:hypothetical protein, partial [Fulvivirga sp.]|uniref:hypothetical protein n=1 Tax=Fulvivirga sp. TaxID=1931237 RepID=UPI0032EC4B8E